MSVEAPGKTLSFDPERCTQVLEELVEIFRKHKPTVGEILIAYGNLGYTLGASIGKYEKGPSIEELEELYYKEPGRLDVALMIQGLQTTTWYESYAENAVDNKDIKEK